MRIGALDSLRGCAALTVVFSHCYVTYPEALRRSIHGLSDLTLAALANPLVWAGYSPLRAFWGGRPAVMLFFVLSGFVLALPFLRGRSPSYGEYVVRRICRIYLPFVAAILFSIWLSQVVSHPRLDALSEWFNTATWDQPLSAIYIAMHLLMSGRIHDTSLDTVMWSLVHEMRISLIFPLLVWATLRQGRATMAASIALYVICDIGLHHSDYGSFAASVFDTGRFIIFFVIGILIAQSQETIVRRLSTLRASTVVTLWVLVACIFMIPQSAPEADVAYGVAAVLSIVLALSSEQSARYLGNRVLTWLGRVSYSLYLVHVPILVSLVHLLYGRLPLLLILSVAVMTSLLVAEIMHVAIEVPAMRLGRSLSRRVAPLRLVSVGPA